IFAVLELVKIKAEGIYLDIEDVKLGYYFNWPNAVKGEAVPVWRVITNKGTYYINAYTGNLEKGE
ncbi:MAG: two-component system regulatory protein YycI, partial [Caldanaerobacter sp.]